MGNSAENSSAGALFIDTFHFWIIAVTAIVLLRAISSGRVREYIWCSLNLFFLANVIGSYVIFVLLAFTTLWLMLFCFRHSNRNHAATLILCSATALFLAYKAGFIRLSWPSSVERVLVGIGFSFVFLRIFDLVRSLQDRVVDRPNPFALVNYLVPFHMLAAGPIQSYADFARQPRVPGSLTIDAAFNGVDRIAQGLFKKFVLAYIVHKTFLTNLEARGFWLIVEVQLLLLWLYLDFSAYSDIAVGLGNLMGVSTPENFDRPWLSRNLIEFWDRWHISLSHWIRRNLFIPIQLKLMRRFPTTDPLYIAAIAIGLSFFMAGVWHGMTTGWLLWGAFHAVGLLTVRLYQGWMQRARSPEDLIKYRSNRLVVAMARALTIEYAAVAFAIVFLVK